MVVFVVHVCLGPHALVFMPNFVRALAELPCILLLCEDGNSEITA